MQNVRYVFASWSDCLLFKHALCLKRTHSLQLTIAAIRWTLKRGHPPGVRDTLIITHTFIITLKLPATQISTK